MRWQEKGERRSRNRNRTRARDHPNSGPSSDLRPTLGLGSEGGLYDTLSTLSSVQLHTYSEIAMAIETETVTK